MKHPLRVNGPVVAMLAFLGLASFGQFASPATAAVTEAEALAAAKKGAQWLAAQQESNGELGSQGDWSMTALAAVGVNAADVRTSPVEPSAQDYYLSLWTGESPALRSPTDYERAILAGYAGGLQTSRLDAHTNLIADLAAQFDGHELGGKGATNADIFGVLALAAAGVPGDVIQTLAQSVREQQDADGGWNFAAGAKTSETDMTGAAIAALCTAGATPQDPTLVRAFAYLHTVEDTATGGFVNLSHVNTDSTAWVLSGLHACGVDPQGSEFTTAAGKTPLDFLLAQQNEDGSFQFRAGDEEENLYSTQDAVRALAGAVFTAPPPARIDSSAPAVRPAPIVAAGTPVPMTLVIDSGGQITGGSSIRMCEVTAAVGATVAQMLQDASEASSPSYCVSDLSLIGGRIARLNGVAAEPGLSTWEIHREGAAAEADTNGTLGLGALVAVQLISPGETSAPAPPSSPSAPSLPTATSSAAPPASAGSTATQATAAVRGPARLRVRVGPLTHVRHGRLTVTLSCPLSTGATGCAGLVRVRVALRAQGSGALRPYVAGEHEVHLAAGTSGTVTIALNSTALSALRTRDDRVAWIVATMRGAGSSGLTSAAAATVLR